MMGQLTGAVISAALATEIAGSRGEAVVMASRQKILIDRPDLPRFQAVI